MFELDYDLAERIAAQAVASGGKIRVSISVDENGGAEPIDARVDTFDPDGKVQLSEVDQPGVCVLSKMRLPK